MKSKILLFTSSLWCICNAVIAQPEIEFEDLKFNFGTIVEGTLASHEFTFINTGNQPLILNQVSASCGCTTPDWTREPVLQGKKGVIRVVYDSNSRPGSFSKSIVVKSNAANHPMKTLSIQGVVLRKTESKPVITSEATAKIEIEKNEFILGKVELNQVVPFQIRVSNTGINKLELFSIQSDCKCIFFDKNQSMTIEPGMDKLISLLYQAKTSGNRQEEVTVYSSDPSRNAVTFVVTAENVQTLQENSLLKEKNSVYKF
jgi:hypothetical protein